MLQMWNVSWHKFVRETRRNPWNSSDRRLWDGESHLTENGGRWDNSRLRPTRQNIKESSWLETCCRLLSLKIMCVLFVKQHWDTRVRSSSAVGVDVVAGETWHPQRLWKFGKLKLYIPCENSHNPTSVGIICTERQIWCVKSSPFVTGSHLWLWCQQNSQHKGKRQASMEKR